jgi:hypothetical protein
VRSALAVEMCLLLDRALIDALQPGFGAAQVAAQSRLGAQKPDEFVAAPDRLGVGVGDELLKLDDQVGAHLLVALGSLRVVADHKSLRAGPLVVIAVPVRPP